MEIILKIKSNNNHVYIIDITEIKRCSLINKFGINIENLNNYIKKYVKQEVIGIELKQVK